VFRKEVYLEIQQERDAATVVSPASATEATGGARGRAGGQPMTM
jgi:sRNA-binding carbon storage regulator CsrA